MRSLTAAVFSVAALLSVNTSVFAQDAQSSPGPALSPGLGGTDHTPPIIEAGRYHPCPASVGLPDGRTVCLGLDQPRRHVHVSKRSRCWGWSLYLNSYSNWY
jgi:hypothetical protein